MNRRKTESRRPLPPAWRNRALLACFALGALALEVRLTWLQLVDAEFYAAKSASRQVRDVEIPVHRGQFLARDGEPLAVSTPVGSIYVNPQEVPQDSAEIYRLAEAIGRDGAELEREITSRLDRVFLWVRRQMSPAAAARVLELDIPGVDVRREYKRYFPAHEATCHLIGFTDTDDVGIEGLEKVYDAQLTGTPGSKLVQRDERGHHIADLKLTREPVPGRDITLSIDLGLQYTAYRELKRAVTESGASWGSMVILDVETGELLAMVNQPACNPNEISKQNIQDYRNFAITDPIEPGSTLKPLVLAAALANGYTPDTPIDVPKVYAVAGTPITDHPVDAGIYTVTEILAMSSNAGMATIGETLEPGEMLRNFKALGLGESTTGAVLSGFESPGILDQNYQRWGRQRQATLSYGYGLSVTALQLARAYAAIGSGGWLPEVQLEAGAPPKRRQAMSVEVADGLMAMLEAVVDSEDGTGSRAAIPNYRVAGKTGTAKIPRSGRYLDDSYRAVFAGLAPASHPRFAAVVVINDPRGAEYGGGQIAAPIFARVISKALSMYAVAPDALEAEPTQLSRAEVGR